MSAKVAITIPGTPQITVPLKAIQHDDNDQASVKLINPKTHETTTQNIIAGDTQLNSIIVLSGLHEGDQIVVPH